MSLKSYIQSLIDVLLKKSVENTSPGDIVSTQTVETATQDFISPVDGFVRVNTSKATKSENYITVGSENVAHQHTTATGYVNRVDLPVKKGSYVKVDFDGHDSVWVGFVARVGRGFLNFLKRLFGEVAYA